MTDPIQEAATLAARGVGELRDANANLTVRVTELDKAYSIAQAELEMTRAALDRMTHERDFYQRFTVEMATQMNNVAALVADCMTRAKLASSRPNGAAPAPEVATEPAVPKFLTEPRQEADQ